MRQSRRWTAHVSRRRQLEKHGGGLHSSPFFYSCVVLDYALVVVLTRQAGRKLTPLKIRNAEKTVLPIQKQQPLLAH